MLFNKNKTHNKKVGAIITMSVLSIVAIALGGGLGIYLHGLTTPKTSHEAVVQDNGNNAALLDTYGQVIEKDSGVDFTTLVDKNVFTYSDIANISLMLLAKHDNYMTQGKGSAKAAGVVQEIRDTVIRDGTNYLEESNSSSSVVSMASRAYQGADGIEFYAGKPVGGNPEVASFNSTSTHFTLTEYFNSYGRTVDTPIIYIINDQTVNPSSTTLSGDPATSFTKTSAGYTLEMELAPSRSTVNYAVQMTTISNLKSLTFNYVHLTFFLSEKLELESITSHESYVVTLQAIPLPTTTEGHLRTVIATDGGFKIPDTSTPIVYRTGD
jgi:hypothetical protein